jgi:Dolichyl-phosphate-mannose-protein mannosyltransferase
VRVINRIGKPPRAVEYTLTALAALCFALGYGFSFGFDNQLVYFVKSLALVDRGLFHADWFTNHTTHYHRVFIYFGALLLKLNARGWGVAIAQFVCVFLGGLCLYRIAKRVAGEALAVPAFCLLLAMLFLTRTSSVGTSYLFDTILQPSTLGALGSIAGTWLFVEERWLESGVAIALGGLFHANYLVLAYPIFGLAHLALGFRGLRQRLLQQFAPIIAGTLAISPLLLAAARGTPSADAMEILFRIRSPHHYNPARFERNFMPFAGWQMLGIGSGWLLHRTPNGRRLGAILTGLLVTIWTGTLLTTLVDVPKVAQIFVWRFAPNADIACQILIACALAQVLARPALARAYPRAALGLICGGLGVFGLFDRSKEGGQLPRLLLAYFGLAVLARLIDLALDLAQRSLPKLEASLSEVKRVLRYSPWAVALVVMYLQTPERVQEGLRRSTLLKDDEGRANLDLYRWLRESSPRDAIYLTPPDLDGARYLGQRAIVVDWKAVPLIPSELLVWYERLCDVTGRRVGGTGDLAGYQAMDAERLALLEAKYHPNYLVLRRGGERRFASLPVVYQNGGFSVLKIVPAAPKP